MNFKLRKTRIILLLSITWCALAYILIKGGYVYLFNKNLYYEFDWDFDLSDWLLFTSPVLIYWGIQIVIGIYKWVKSVE
jgi:hypothetical protein